MTGTPSHKPARLGDEAASDRSPDDRITILSTRLLANDWGVLTRYTLRYRRKSGTTQVFTRETYDRGDGAAILLYDEERQVVLLTRQFRFPAYITGHREDLIEVCGGLLDHDDPATAMRREVGEEMGVEIGEITPIGCYYMSPGSVTERIHFFTGAYRPRMRIGPGGGLEGEGEEIDVMEVAFPEALQMIDDGRILDAKTILLLQHAAIKGLLNVQGAAR